MWVYARNRPWMIMTNFLTEQDIAYFEALWLCRTHAVRPVRRTVVFRDGTAPRPSDCHANAARWASEDSETVPVHGWLVECDDGYHLRLAAHSLVRDQEGTFIEITPTGPYDLPFLVHSGTAEDFFALLPRSNSIAWPVHQGVTEMVAPE